MVSQLDRAKRLDHSKTCDNMTAATCDMMRCKTGLVICLQECYPGVEDIASKEREREIQSNREGERDGEENRDESGINSDGEIDSEEETFRNVNKFVEI